MTDGDTDPVPLGLLFRGNFVRIQIQMPRLLFPDSRRHYHCGLAIFFIQQRTVDPMVHLVFRVLDNVCERHR